jgi:hypothetical protein
MQGRGNIIIALLQRILGETMRKLLAMLIAAKHAKKMVSLMMLEKPEGITYYMADKTYKMEFINQYVWMYELLAGYWEPKCK